MRGPNRVTINSPGPWWRKVPLSERLRDDPRALRFLRGKPKRQEFDFRVRDLQRTVEDSPILRVTRDRLRQHLRGAGVA